MCKEIIFVLISFVIQVTLVLQWIYPCPINYLLLYLKNKKKNGVYYFQPLKSVSLFLFFYFIRVGWDPDWIHDAHDIKSSLVLGYWLFVFIVENRDNGMKAWFDHINEVMLIRFHMNSPCMYCIYLNSITGSLIIGDEIIAFYSEMLVGHLLWLHTNITSIVLI